MQDLHAFLLNLQARGEGSLPPLTPKWKDNYSTITQFKCKNNYEHLLNCDFLEHSWAHIAIYFVLLQHTAQKSKL